jgi:hypothetical protein
MSISYSGIVGYGKATLPSVEEWNMNTNILRDPPKSVTTRKIDKVGETSVIAQTLGESDDRFCEAINYYARGQNPMVSISYSNNGTNGGARASILDNKGQTFLPYRVARGGAFRPPIRRQEDLLPLSRQPRIWQTVNTQPHAIEYTKRIKNCGKCEDTKEVKNALLKTSCQSCKTLTTDPDLNAPNRLVGFIQDPLLQDITTQKSCMENNEAVKKIHDMMQQIALERNYPLAEGYTIKSNIIEKPIEQTIILPETRQTAVAYTNKAKTKEQPVVFRNIHLSPNRPTYDVTLNKTTIKETPIVLKQVSLTQNRPTAIGHTNMAQPGVYNNTLINNTVTLRDRPKKDVFEGSYAIPKTTTFVPTKTLVKVR